MKSQHYVPLAALRDDGQENSHGLSGLAPAWLRVLAAICFSAESCSMSRTGRASAQTIASRITVSSLSCRVSPDVDQFVDPEIRHTPSTITILRAVERPHVRRIPTGRARDLEDI